MTTNDDDEIGSSPDHPIVCFRACPLNFFSPLSLFALVATLAGAFSRQLCSTHLSRACSAMYFSAGFACLYKYLCDTFLRTRLSIGLSLIMVGTGRPSKFRVPGHVTYRNMFKISRKHKNPTNIELSEQRFRSKAFGATLSEQSFRSNAPVNPSMNCEDFSDTQNSGNLLESDILSSCMPHLCS